MDKQKQAIERIMNGLQCSYEEAKNVYNSDIAIDRNQPMPFDLPKEKIKIGQKFAKVGTKTKKTPTVYKFNTKKPKENPLKENIINQIYHFLLENDEIKAENVEILNKSRQITFSADGELFELNLIQKRKKGV